VVVAAVRSYLKNLEFDGQVFLARIEDAIQAVAGVKDVKLVEVSARSGNGVPVVITRVYETQAGYIVEDDAAAATFSDTLSFIPYGG
jgi:uncharacterized phage protein gp47/JayE